MNQLDHGLRPFIIAVVLISIVCLTSWSGASGSSGTRNGPTEIHSTAIRTEMLSGYADRQVGGESPDCGATVRAVQEAVTQEAYATAEMRRAICALNSLPAEDRSGRPQAIFDSRMRGFDAARKKTAAAYQNARGCDTSRVKRPEISDYNPAAGDAIIACYARNQLRGRGPGNYPECDRLIETLNCGSIKVVGAEETPQPQDVSVAETIPADLKPECRDAYLKLKAAERESENADKRFREIATSGYGAAGAKGTAMLNRARMNQQAAMTALSNARAKLNQCTNRSTKGECNGFLGTWRSSFGTMTITFGADNLVEASYDFDAGSINGIVSADGKVLTGTYTENKAKGRFRFTLAADGQSFTGNWNRTSGTREPPSGTWDGKCVSK